MKHEEAFELLPEYALGSLGSDELNRFLSHLESCAVCKGEVRVYSEIVGDISLIVPIVEPPTLLRSSILYQASKLSAKNHPTKESRWASFTRSFGIQPSTFAFASLVLIFIMLVTNLWLWRRVNTLEKQNDFRLVSLVGTNFSPDASGLLVISEDGMEGTLVVAHLPKLNSNLQYQLWLIEDQLRTNGGVFSVDEDGYANISIESEEPLSGYDGFGITIEPYGGSPGPTGDKVLGGEL